MNELPTYMYDPYLYHGLLLVNRGFFKAIDQSAA